MTTTDFSVAPGRHGPRRLRDWMWAFCTLTASAVLIVTSGACFNTLDEEGGSELAAEPADHITYGVTKNISRDGIREAELTADSMYIWNDSTHALIQGLRLIVYDRSIDQRGTLRAIITADSGRLVQRTEELTAIGNAVASIPGEDREINGEILNFSPANDRIWSDSPVVMRQGDCTVKGDGFDATLTFDQLTITGTRDQECGS